MKEFPEFMKQPVNKIAAEDQYTPGIEGYVYDGADGGQVAFWTCEETSKSATHAHPYDEYFVVLQGRYTITIQGKSIPLYPGDEFFIPHGTVHSGSSISGTRTIHAFGGHRANRVE
jgi:mannose-6-phosphate isomerase-like protein (cupin superfamily)